MTVSVLVYGRNDSHGYNLHKRAAISLNCIAEVLDDPDDEIVFVDYNTPNDLPTFPEAIRDTLTPRAWDRIRVLRVRPAAHAAFADRTHLEVLEPVARNAGLRRSNPANRWVLSTNTDMVFLPGAAGSLSGLLSGLEDGFYHLPRFELPESLWESFDRANPQGTLQAVDDAARALHLQQVVHGSETILYDAPGDFQLCLRDDLFAIHGFDEAMLRGWHVDSNLAKRMAFVRGPVRSLEGRLSGFHCDHTRQVTVLHRPSAPQNDSDRFVDRVTTAQLPDQAADWGLAALELEGFKLSAAPSARYLAAAQSAIGELQGKPVDAHYTSARYNRLEYDWRTALPFLVDALATFGDVEIGYAGVTPQLLESLTRALGTLSPGARVLLRVEDEAQPPAPNSERVAWDEWRDRPDLFVFEIGARPDGHAREDAFRSGAVITLFERLAAARAGGRPTRVVAVNATNTEFEPLLNRRAHCSPAPFGARVRQGYLIAPPEGAPPAPPQRWADRFMGGRADPWAWERGALLAGVDEALDLAAGSRPRVLLACHLAEPLAHMLASAGAEVDFVDPLAMLGEPGAQDWRAELAKSPALVPDAIGRMREGELYDAIVCPQEALVIRGWAHAGQLFAALDSRLRPGGALVFSLASPRNDADWVAAFVGGLTAATGYRPLAQALPSSPGAAVFSWRKSDDAAGGADAVAQAFQLPLTFADADVTDRMQPKDGVVNTGQGWSILRSVPIGHALYGPYVQLAPGAYNATVCVSASGVRGLGPVLRLEVALGPDNVVASREAGPRELSRGAASIEFNVAAETDGPAEIRLTHFGRADLTVSRVSIHRSAGR